VEQLAFETKDLPLPPTVKSTSTSRTFVDKIRGQKRYLISESFVFAIAMRSFILPSRAALSKSSFCFAAVRNKAAGHVAK